MKHLLAPFLLFSFIVPALSAQQPVISDEIIVTASALPERTSDTPATVTVVTREDIDARLARDVSDVLREVPGLTIARIGSSGHQTSLFTRGSNPAHTLVMWNGIEINAPFFGGYDWGQFSTAGVEQIEVVRGPYSALYGSDAMAGVVNIVTVPERNGVRAVVEGGEGLRNAQLSGTWTAGGLTFSGGVDRRDDEGFAANDDFDQRTGNLSVRWTSDRLPAIALNLRAMRYDLGVPTNLNAALDRLVASPLRRQDGREQQISIPVDQTIGTFSYEVLVAEHDRHDTLDDPGDPFGPFWQATDFATRRARLTTRTRTAFGTIVAGAEHESTTVDDETNYGVNFVDRKRRERSLFLEDRWSRDGAAGSRLELSAGVRHDEYDTFGSQTSPRVAAAWIRGSSKFRAAYGEAFRAPSVGEMYSPFGGNPDLHAERSRSFEAGFDHYLRSGALSFTLFHDRYRDLITNAGFVLANIGRARSRGAEVALEGRLSERIRGGVTWTFTDAERLDTGAELPRRPRHSGSAFIAIRHGITQWNVVVFRSGARQDVLPVMPFTPASNRAFTTVDANVQFDLGRFTPYVQIENATDTEYEQVLGYPSPSRRAVAGVRFGI